MLASVAEKWQEVNRTTHLEGDELNADEEKEKLGKLKIRQNCLKMYGVVLALK